MRFATTVTVILLSTIGSAFADEKPNWLKFDEAFKASSLDGKPVCIYVLNDGVNISCSMESEGTDRAFCDKALTKLLREFHLTRCQDVATAKRLKVDSKAPALMFFDGDGKELLFNGSQRSAFLGTMQSKEQGLASIKQFCDAALQQYPENDVAWATGDLPTILKQAAEAKKLAVLAFVDDKEPSLALLDTLKSRWISKLHDRLLFVKLPFHEKNDACKTWSVSKGPALLWVNPLEEEPKRSVLGKLIQKKERRTVRNACVEALKAFEKILTDR